MATFSVNWSAPVSPLAGTILAGQCVVPNAAGLYLVATAANRALYGRSDGVAMTSGDSANAVALIEAGPVENALTGLGTGAASWVRVSSAGQFERCTPSGADDIVGWCETTGRLHSQWGTLTAAIVNAAGGGGGTVPTGTGIPHIVGGAQVAAAALIVDADVTSVGLAKLTGLGASVSVFLGTPSGANLGTALTSALPVAKGGTGATASTGSGNVVLATGPTLAGTTILSFLRMSGVTANASSATINDMSFGGNTRIRFTGGPVITGLDSTGVSDGDIRFLHTDTTSVILNHEDAGSLAANRLKLRGSLARTLVATCVVPIMYDGTASRWVLFGGDYTNP